MRADICVQCSMHCWLCLCMLNSVFVETAARCLCVPQGVSMFAALLCLQRDVAALCVCALRCVCSYWSPLNFTSETIAFADGGSVDNLAVTPLLRRRMTKILMLVAASDSVTAATDAADWGGLQYDVSGLFGAAPATHPSYNPDGTITGVSPDLFNRKLQVRHSHAH